MILPCVGGLEHAATGTASADRLAAWGAEGIEDSQALHRTLIEAAAVSASAPRLLLQSFSIAPLHLLVDVHTAGGSRHVPITVDTHRWATFLLGHFDVHSAAKQFLAAPSG